MPTFLHVDMDAFFAAIEELDDPRLRGTPLIVGGPVRRGVVSTANYEARRYGIHSAMPMARAVKLCPAATVIRPRMERYADVSSRLMQILRSFTPLVEPLSLDEAFLDLAGTERLHGDPVEAARRIKKRIREELGLTASIGVAPIKFVAKIASDLRKPDGLTVIPPEEVIPFLHSLPISRLWGVGPVTARSLEAMGIRTIGDLARYPRQELVQRLGSAGEHIHRLSWAEDPREVVPEWTRRSLGDEQTHERDLCPAELSEPLLGHSERVASGLRAGGLAARTITLKLRCPDHRLITRSTTLAEPTDSERVIFREASRLLSQFASGRRFRLSGIAASHLVVSCDAPGQLALPLAAPPKDAKLGQALDAVRARFGEDAIRLGRAPRSGHRREGVGDRAK